MTNESEVDGRFSCDFDRPLRIAALIKQVPVGETMTLGSDGRLVRDGLALEMNAYCRRAVSKGVEWARKSGGSCTVFTLGPPSAEEVLREAIAWGADAAIHLCDPAFAGSDTLATARSLAAGLGGEGAFDLILVGRNSLDGDTGQIGPELAQLVGLPFATGVRHMGISGESLTLTLEYDDGWEDVKIVLPALLSVAERLCEPCKIPAPQRAAVPSGRIRVLSAADLGAGPWGQDGSPTRVGRTRVLHHDREGKLLHGTCEEQVLEATALLLERGALVLSPGRSRHSEISVPAADTLEGSAIAVLVESERQQVSSELLGEAARLAAAKHGWVHALAFDGVDATSLGRLGADAVTSFSGSTNPEDVALGLAQWAREEAPWAVIGPSTAFGREVLGRLAAALGAGLIGDATGLEVAGGELVVAKPAFSGALVADITCTSKIRMVSVRPGVLPLYAPRDCVVDVSVREITPRSRVRLISRRRDDDVEVLARADTVIGIGASVAPDQYEELSGLAALLGAEFAATRKVTDNGWAPRARQVGVTGRSIAPRLYVAIGLSGKFNHMVGVRASGTILAINNDPDALVFSHCDIGILGDWRTVVPALAAQLWKVKDQESN